MDACDGPQQGPVDRVLATGPIRRGGRVSEAEPQAYAGARRPEWSTVEHRVTCVDCIGRRSCRTCCMFVWCVEGNLGCLAGHIARAISNRPDERTGCDPGALRREGIRGCF